MRERLTTLLPGIALGLVLSAFPVAAADVLQVGGTGGAAALLAHVGKPFTQQTGITVEVKPGLGSSGGISALAAGQARFDLDRDAGLLSEGLAHMCQQRSSRTGTADLEHARRGNWTSRQHQPQGDTGQQGCETFTHCRRPFHMHR